DLHLTAEAFKRTLMEEEFMHLEAGIVLQAYLPDSWEEQMKLCAWAKERVEQGGARIKIRLVKGANLAMEKVEASMHDWAQAPYGTKAQVDANYKRMLHYGCMPENARYVQFGVASHNLFDLCYAMLLREREGVKDYVEFEMLEGMANHQARVIRESADGLLLYAPVVLKEDFHSAIAYLVRRLDENTSEENFLHDLFGMAPGSRTWDIQKRRFLKACQEKDSVKYGPNRTQNRATDPVEPTHYRDAFANERDTDWSLRQNSEWINGLIAAEKEKSGEEIPLVINGEQITTNLWGVGRDPSRHNEVSYKFAYADFDQVEHALDTADKARTSWAARSAGERAEILHNAARELSVIRGEAIAAMVRDAGKAPTEADVEVSEAIDFCRYYAEGLARDGMN
ncbi:proline dehydrogenase family protein, partial [Bacteroides caccae]|uniref:proline dehydrogenase family protein n=1 Tax=Bacteroides caccae TaxID=47678 RepID=UPI00186497C5